MSTTPLFTGETGATLALKWKTYKRHQGVIGFYSHNNDRYRSFSNFFQGILSLSLSIYHHETYEITSYLTHITML